MPKNKAMLGKRSLIVLRSVLVGWAMLLLFTAVIEPPLLAGTVRLAGGYWLATAKLSLDCLALAATGWLIGRLHRSAPLFAVLVFSATLAFAPFGPLPEARFTWLVRLTANAFSDRAYLNPLGSAALEYLLLFASLIGGTLLSRPAHKPLSVINEDLR
jgi:hypothetical protein